VSNPIQEKAPRPRGLRRYQQPLGAYCFSCADRNAYNQVGLQGRELREELQQLIDRAGNGRIGC
jgi:hypothetical protein